VTASAESGRQVRQASAATETSECGNSGLLRVFQAVRLERLVQKRMTQSAGDRGESKNGGLCLEC
jgi:hypothetical protein